MFEIKSFADYYAMLVQDFDDFMRETHSGRRAIHCSITANHMKDWVWNDWLAGDARAREQLGFTDSASFYKWLGRNVWYGILREVAEGAKHFANPVYETHLVTGPGIGGGGLGLQGQGYLVIDLGEVEGEVEEDGLDEFGEPTDAPDGGDQRYLTAAALLEVIVRFWRDFFMRHRPDLKLIHSVHHVDPYPGR